MNGIREWIYACLEANHFLCGATLMSVSLVAGLPFMLVEEVLNCLLILIGKEK